MYLDQVPLLLTLSTVRPVKLVLLSATSIYVCVCVNYIGP